MTEPEGTPPPSKVIAKTVRYREKDEHILRRLAGALLLHWDELSDDLQDLLIDQAAVVDDRETAPHDVTDIEGFIRSVKIGAVAKAPKQGD